MATSKINAPSTNSNYQLSFRNISVGIDAVIGGTLTIPRAGVYLIYFHCSSGGWFNKIFDASSQDYHQGKDCIFTRRFNAGETFGFYNGTGSPLTGAWADVGYIMLCE